MNNIITIYHGSEKIIEVPEFGKGKPYNDYGLGFYCTEYIDLAKEWACDERHGGYANQYTLDLTGLRVLDLNSKEFCIIHWISVLLQYRKFTLDTDMGNSAREYIIKNFPVDISSYDVVKGYRANDSYFSYARDFLQGGISVRRLAQVMKLGNLGNQIVLKSRKAFSQIKFVGYEEAPQAIHFPLRKKRDELARSDYLTNRQGDTILPDDIYVLDIIRGEIKADDPRLQ